MIYILAFIGAVTVLRAAYKLSRMSWRSGKSLSYFDRRSWMPR